MDANQENPAAIEAATEKEKNRAPTLYFIAICKLAKGVALLLIGAGIYSLARGDVDLQGDFDKFIEWVRLDPEHSFFRNISGSLANITPGNIRATALAFFLYGCFLLVGGTGLAIRAKWAIWLTIGESAFFIPIEIFELTRQHPHIDHVDSPDDAPLPTPAPHLFTHPRIGLAIVLALNVLIVWYLLKNRQRLFRHHA
jgi:uncharacterized membrane protein (DUF2068 family)